MNKNMEEYLADMAGIKKPIKNKLKELDRFFHERSLHERSLHERLRKKEKEKNPIIRRLEAIE